MRLFSPLFPALVALSLAFAAPAQAAGEPYEVTVWADAQYDAAGALTTLEFPQAKDYAPALLENLRTRIAARPANPRLSDGAPATFQTGVRVTLTVTPETGSVSVDEMVDMPRVLRMTKARFAQDLSGSANWDGRVQATCTVTVKGRCSSIVFPADNGGAPDEARRIAKDALAGWRFEPQKLGGKPVEGQATVSFEIERDGVTRPTIPGREN